MKKSNHRSPRAKTMKQHSHVCFIFCCLCAIVFGLYVCFVYGPDLQEENFRLKTKANYETTQFLQKDGNIMTRLLPEWLGLAKSIEPNIEIVKPDWSIEHWTPVAVNSFQSDPQFTMCKLNFKEYFEGGPNKLPMFKDLLAASQCRGYNSKSMRLSEIKAEMKNEESQGRPKSTMLTPSGFVFHESRVGSTLVANLLGSDPFNMVFCESSPPATVLLHCSGCSHEAQVSRFRDTVLAMGRSPVHKRAFFKFQSATSTQMKIALEAFPDVPWVFIYRDPVQTMMSHLDPAKSSSMSVCLRSKRSPSDKVRATLEKFSLKPKNAPNEAMCAAHLNMLCEHAIEAYESFGSYQSHPQKTRGLFLDYKYLPGGVPNIILPHFGIANLDKTWLRTMEQESQQYSKSSKRNQARGKSGDFKEDSNDKEERSTASIREWANKILEPNYRKMSALTLAAMEDLGINASSAALKVIPGSKGLGGSQKRLLSYEYEAFRGTHNSSRYEEVECPDIPPDNYPITYDMKRILDNWNPDDTDIPPIHFDSICRFDYQKEFEKALAYREAEKPFIVYNVPEVDNVVQKWSDFDYLNNRVGPKTMYHAETSSDNHFMYWRKKSKRIMEKYNFKPPTGKKPIGFLDWLKVAATNHNKSIDEREHLYFRITGQNKDHFIFNELPFFYPKKSLFIVNPREQRGIHCRFGMKSVIAECHYDGSRNFVASLGGMRRFILAHPDQCQNLHLLPLNHPSGRHSEVDWSKPDYGKFKRFAKAQANEIITTPGDVLYLPTYWFHFIVSLNINFQCNTRSGKSFENEKVLGECGF